MRVLPPPLRFGEGAGGRGSGTGRFPPHPYVKITSPIHRATPTEGSASFPERTARIMSKATPRQAIIQKIATTQHLLEHVDYHETHFRDIFGSNVFNEAVQKDRLSKPVFKALQKNHPRGGHARPADRRPGRQRHEGLGDRHGGDPLHPPVPPAHRGDGREARQLPQPDLRRRRGRRVQRQGTGPRRAGCLVVPVRRPARHLRGPRLHRLGPDQPGLHPRTRQRRDPGHPHRLRLLDRRGPGPQDPAAQIDGCPFQAGHARPQALWQERLTASSPRWGQSKNTS